jgi:hypothetical protein
MGPRTRAPRCLLRIALRNCYAVAPLRLLPKSSLCAIRSLLRDMCANKSPSRDLCGSVEDTKLSTNKQHSLSAIKLP